MQDHTKSHRDTQFFSRLSPAVFQAILDVIPAMVVTLNWEPLAGAFLADVLRQVSLLGDPLTLKHFEFARILWGKDITKVAAQRRIGRAVSSLKRCQSFSGFLAVWIDLGGRVEANGKVEYFDTTYRLRDFFAVFSEIQTLALEQDLMALPKRERRITQLAVTQSICDARGYQALPPRMRQQRHFQEEKAKPGLLPKVEPALPSPIVSFSEYHAAFQERLYAEIAKTPANSLEGQTFIDDVLKATRMTERRWRDLGRAKGGSR